MPKGFEAFSIKGDRIVFLNNDMPLTLFLMICLSVLVIFNVVYFFAKSGKKSNSNESNANTNLNTSENNSNKNNDSANIKINPPKM